ncbi:unnamed protein product [Leptidea sinapis]|uniref:Uncharacterized protein n=1 Tax=Leptidea sinapis TaxID=189913 RepID=A0A5E4QB35_9NEOP|nr:unnamed protein product [Leptidea sinapis]
MDSGPEHQIFQSLYRQTEPVRVILDSKSQNTFIDVVKNAVFHNGEMTDARCKLFFVSSKDYSESIRILACYYQQTSLTYTDMKSN